MPKGVKIKNNGYMKCTKEEKEGRIEQGAEWLLANPDSRWIEFIRYAEAVWGVQTSMAKKYLKWCKESLGKLEAPDVEAERRRGEASLKQMLSLAIEAKDAKLALQIRQEINKIQGLYTQKIEVTDNSELPIFKAAPIEASVEDVMVKRKNHD